MTEIMQELAGNGEKTLGEPLDFGRLSQTLGNELVEQLPFLLSSLLDEIPVQMSQIGYAIKADAWPEGVRMAHGLKGTSRWFAADALELAALELEEACHVENLHAAERGLLKVKLEAARLREWLERYTAHS
ncbi:MAG: Hpt domain-containing protein [Ardenticatenales bacterium]|nr:Hpt domain-containing protein [Ardenticatenales bacterium]